MLLSISNLIINLVGIICWIDVSCATPQSNSGYNAYNYDLTTPMFTPDGRLLQVEYAALSSTYSTPLVCVLVPPSSKEDPGGIVLATLSSSRECSITDEYDDEKKLEDGTEQNDDNEAKNVIKPTIPIQQQKRVVELRLDHPILIADHQNELGERSHYPINILVGMSGILSDNLELLRIAQKQIDSWHHSYGNCQDQEVVYRVAKAIGDACQSHSFGGGLRPYGANLLLCSVENAYLSDCPTSRFTVCTTHPSGMVHKYSKMLNTDSKSLCSIVIGGTRQQQSQIQSKLQAVVLDSTNQVWKTTIIKVVETLWSDYQKQTPERNRKIRGDDLALPRLEMVLQSPRWGLHRIESDEATVLLNKVVQR